MQNGALLERECVTSSKIQHGRTLHQQKASEPQSKMAANDLTDPSGEPHLPFQVKPLSSVLMDDLKVAHKYGGNDGAGPDPQRQFFSSLLMSLK